jgi:acetylornithine deacetylase/succinyl-diaminopimelate desuccinylase-like protein
LSIYNSWAAILSTMELEINTTTNILRTSSFNIIADSKKGDDNKVVVIGSHIDSVMDGPGYVQIN